MVLLSFAAGNAQTVPEPLVAFPRSGSEPLPAAWAPATRGLRPEPVPAPNRKASWLAPLASLIVPGAGQGMLGQQRGAGYLVAEGFLVIRSMRAHRDANEARNGYRGLAANVARARFGSDRPVGPWEYYETLEHFTESGAYDLGTGARLVPETNEATYNGRQWLQARETYWARADQPPAEGSPEYQRALAFYTSRAVSGSFQWSWRENLLLQGQYIQTIRESNRSKQNLVSTLGLVATNHLVSVVDAYITVRLRRYGGAGMVGATVKTEVRSAGASGDAEMAVRVSVPVPRSRERR